MIKIVSMNNLDNQYTDLLKDILKNGTTKGDRTGTGNISVFGRMIRHKMSEGFPLITTKKIYFKGVLVELLWFLSGSTNIKFMLDNDCNIWVGDAYKKFEQSCIPGTGKKMTKKEFTEMIKTDPWFANTWGDLGPVYGKQWRDWQDKPNGLDQIADLIFKLKNNPEDRRMIVSAWNVPEIPKMTLPPCHYSFQCYARPLSRSERIEIYFKKYVHENAAHEDNEWTDSKLSTRNIPTYELSLMFNLRSNDVPLGLPFNLASYGLLLEILAKHVNMVPGELIASIGDTHIYLNQVPMIKKQIDREAYPLPTLKISDREVNDIADYMIEDFEIIGYQSQAAIKIPLSN